MIDAQRLLQEVRENHARLIACPRHDFQPEGDKRLALARKYKCTGCAGWVDGSAKLWYDRGLQHGADGGRGP